MKHDVYQATALWKFWETSPRTVSPVGCNQFLFCMTFYILPALHTLLYRTELRSQSKQEADSHLWSIVWKRWSQLSTHSWSNSSWFLVFMLSDRPHIFVGCWAAHRWEHKTTWRKLDVSYKTLLIQTPLWSRKKRTVWFTFATNSFGSIRVLSDDSIKKARNDNLKLEREGNTFYLVIASRSVEQFAE